MAIDTAEKRKSISGIWLPLIPGVTPNATQDAEWRQQSGWSYSGIATTSPGSFPFTYHRQSDGLIFHRSWSN